MSHSKQWVTAAFFDLDGTLVKANVVQHYLEFVKARYPGLKGWMIHIKILMQVPLYLCLDRLDRGWFNRVFFRNYRNESVERCKIWGQHYCDCVLFPKLFPAAKTRIAQHQKQGDRIFLVTGSLDFIVAPLVQRLGLDGALATQLEVVNGYYTGRICGVPLANEVKRKLIYDLASDFDITLEKSSAYGDSIADLPMLRAVGHPVAVNPDRILSKIADQAKWPIESWTIESINTRKLSKGCPPEI